MLFKMKCGDYINTNKIVSIGCRKASDWTFLLLIDLGAPMPRRQGRYSTEKEAKDELSDLVAKVNEKNS